MHLIFLVVFTLVASAYSIDCSVSRDAPILYKDALTCLSNIPINEEYRQTALDNFQKTADSIYVFQKLTSPSDSRVDVSVDIPQRLEQIRSATYANEFDFINDFLAIPRDLRDCHLLFFPPTPYGEIVATVPFLFGAYKESASKTVLQIIGVVENSVAAYEKLNIKFDVDLKTLNGFTVDTINEIPAIDFVTEFARNQVGFSEELSQRFEASLDQPSLEPNHFIRGYFGKRGLHTGFPKEISLRFSVSNKSTKYFINVPFLLELSPDSYYTEVPLTSCHTETRRNIERDEPIPLFRDPAKVRSIAQKRDENDNDDIETVKVTEDVFFYKFKDTGIVAFPTWTKTGLILNDIYDGFDQLCAKETKNLLIDVQNNLGGFQCVAQTVAYYLFGEQVFEHSDFEQTPNSQLLMQAMLDENYQMSYWSPAKYVDPESHQKLETNNEWIKTQVQKDIFKYPSTRSISYDCTSYYKNVPKMKCKFEKVSILTNGVCASACDIFSSYLQQKHDVRVIGVGGIDNEHYSVGTCGAQPISDYDLRDGMSVAKIQEKYPDEHDNFPTITPCSTQFSFPFREIETFKELENGKSFPLQYYYDPVTVRLPRTTKSISSRRQQWIDAIDLRSDPTVSSTNYFVVVGLIGAFAFAIVCGIIFIVLYRSRRRNQFVKMENVLDDMEVE